MATKKPVLVIGAGLSGLALARLLTTHAVPVIVFEQSTADRSQGYGITAREWAFKPLLEDLGNGYSVLEFQGAVATDRGIGGTGWVNLTFRNSGTGETLFNPDPTRPGQESLFRANRSVLRNWLAEGVDIRYEHKLVGVDGGPGNVRVSFENGAVHEGGLVVAADGVHSAVRNLLIPHIQQPEILPVILFHGKRHMNSTEWETFKSHLGGSNIAAGVGDSFNNFITVANAAGGPDGGVHLDWSYSRARANDTDPLWMPDRGEIIKVPQHLLKEIRSRDLVPPFSTLVNADDVKKDKVFNWRIYSVFISRSDLDHAAKNHGVVFIGDAVHAMPIFGGEGGNHAILDGVELSRAVRANCGDGQGRMLGEKQVEAVVRSFYDGALQRGQDAARRCVQRFSGFHKPIGEWLKVAEMAKSR